MKNLSFIKPSDCDLGENWKDYFIEISSIKKGETFYECYFGKNIKLIALEDAKRVKHGWVCIAKDSHGDKVEIFISADTKYNGVSFFKTPQYLEYDEEKGYVYPVI